LGSHGFSLAPPAEIVDCGNSKSVSR